MLGFRSKEILEGWWTMSTGHRGPVEALTGQTWDNLGNKINNDVNKSQLIEWNRNQWIYSYVNKWITSVVSNRLLTGCFYDHTISPQKVLIREKSNFIVEKPGNHYLNQVVKVNIISNVHVKIMCHLTECNKKNPASLPS